MEFQEYPKMLDHPSDALALPRIVRSKAEELETLAAWSRDDAAQAKVTSLEEAYAEPEAPAPETEAAAPAEPEPEAEATEPRATRKGKRS